MKTQIHCNKKFISISCYKIDLIKLKQLFEYMNVNHVSILLDRTNEYIFESYSSIDDFINRVSNIKSSIIIFDNRVDSCLIDREIDTLMKKKILVDIDKDENKTSIIINTKNAAVTKEEVKKIFI